MNANIGYLLGAMRDATVDFRKGKNYEVKISQKTKQWLQLIQSIFNKEFGKEGRITRHMKGYWILRINDKQLVTKIIEISGIKIPQENWGTPEDIRNCSDKETITSYIRGFFDAEGGLPRKIDIDSQKYIIFSQKNKESLEFIRKKLQEIKIEPTNLTRCGGVWEFRITKKKCIIEFIEVIGSFHQDKVEKFKILMGILLP